MQIIVTGGNGFIGSHFIEHCLSHGITTPRYDVINIDKETSVSNTWPDDTFSQREWGYIKHKADICDIESLNIDPTHIKALVHFAAESHVDNSMGDMSPFISTNIDGTQRVAEYCAKNGIFMVHISTDEVYGDAKDGRVFQPEDNLDPQNFYSASKAAGDLMVKVTKNKYPDFNYVIVRPSNNYGPLQDNTKFLPKAIKYILEGKPFPMYGDGGFKREWTYVKDTAIAIEQILRQIDHKDIGSGDIVTISSGYSLTNMQVWLKLVEYFKYFDEDYRPLLEFIHDPRGNCHDREYRMRSNCDVRWRSFEQNVKDMVRKAINEKE